MQTSIIDEVKEATLFSLLADETTDFSRQEQLTVCLRYVSIYCGIRERFLWFALAPDLTSLGLSIQLLQILENCGIAVINIKIKVMMVRLPCPVRKMRSKSIYLRNAHRQLMFILHHIPWIYACWRHQKFLRFGQLLLSCVILQSFTPIQTNGCQICKSTLMRCVQSPREHVWRNIVQRVWLLWF